MERAAMDPKKLLEQLRTEHEVLAWEPLPPMEVVNAGSVSEVRNRASLDYLHQHWALADSFEPSSDKAGLRAKLVSLVGRCTYKLLGNYLQEEQALLSQAVQVIDDLDQRCTELSIRLKELSNDVIDRQVAEAENQAKLALWLHLAPPPTVQPSIYEVNPSENRDRPSAP